MRSWRRIIGLWGLTAYFAAVACGPVALHMAVSGPDCHCLAVQGSPDARGAVAHDGGLAAKCSCEHLHRSADDHDPVESGHGFWVDGATCSICDFFAHPIQIEIPAAVLNLTPAVEFAAAVSVPRADLRSTRVFWSRGPPIACCS